MATGSKAPSMPTTANERGTNGTIRMLMATLTMRLPRTPKAAHATFRHT